MRGALVAGGGLLLHAEDIVERAGEWGEGVAFGLGRRCEAGALLRQMCLPEKAVGLTDLGDLREPKSLRLLLLPRQNVVDYIIPTTVLDCQTGIPV